MPDCNINTNPIQNKSAKAENIPFKELSLGKFRAGIAGNSGFSIRPLQDAQELELTHKLHLLIAVIEQVEDTPQVMPSSRDHLGFLHWNHHLEVRVPTLQNPDQNHHVQPEQSKEDEIVSKFKKAEEDLVDRGDSNTQMTKAITQLREVEPQPR